MRHISKDSFVHTKQNIKNLPAIIRHLGRKVVLKWTYCILFQYFHPYTGETNELITTIKQQRKTRGTPKFVFVIFEHQESFVPIFMFIDTVEIAQWYLGLWEMCRGLPGHIFFWILFLSPKDSMCQFSAESMLWEGHNSNSTIVYIAHYAINAAHSAQESHWGRDFCRKMLRKNCFFALKRFLLHSNILSQDI